MHLTGVFAAGASLVRHLVSASDLSRLRRANVLLVAHDVDRGFRYQGNAYSPLLDSLGEQLVRLRHNVLSAAKPYSALYGAKAFGAPVSLNREAARASVRRRLVPSARTDQEVGLWKRVLDIVQPAAVIGIQPAASLCVAGKHNGIKVADLQHGVIDPAVYYNLQAAGRYREEGIPDAVLCWDGYSAQALVRALPHVSTYVIGNPWLDRFLNPRPEDELIQSMERLFGQKFAGVPKGVLVSLQWNPDRPATIAMPRMVADALRYLMSSGWTALIRFHPVQLLATKPETLARTLDEMLGCVGHRTWVDASRAPLPLVLRHSRCHITSHSAVALEAENFGVETGFWSDNPLLEEWFGGYFEARLLRRVRPITGELVRFVEDAAASAEDRLSKTRRDVPVHAHVKVQLQQFLELCSAPPYGV